MTYENKHTPSPWKVSLHKKCDWESPQAEVFAKDGLNDGFIIAELYDQYDGHSNAYLIAAAPELLEALAKIRNLHDENSGIYKMANKAIKKALGEL